jgi:hypothetical protein
MKNPFRAVGNLFRKTLPQGARSFFSKGAGVIGRGLSDVGGITNRILSSPITTGVVGAVAPELLPGLVTAQVASRVASGAGSTLQKLRTAKTPTQGIVAVEGGLKIANKK